MKLTMKTKPGKLTLGQIWKLHLSAPENENAEFVVSVLDLFYPSRDRNKLDIFAKMEKYRQARVGYDSFVGIIKGMVGNG